MMSSDRTVRCGSRQRPNREEMELMFLDYAGETNKPSKKWIFRDEHVDSRDELAAHAPRRPGPAIGTDDSVLRTLGPAAVFQDSLAPPATGHTVVVVRWPAYEPCWYDLVGRRDQYEPQLLPPGAAAESHTHTPHTTVAR